MSWICLALSPFFLSLLFPLFSFLPVYFFLLPPFFLSFLLLFFSCLSSALIQVVSALFWVKRSAVL